MGNVKNPKALFIHDVGGGFAEAFSESFTHMGIATKYFTLFSTAMRFIDSPAIRQIESVILHKDLGQYSGEGDGLSDIIVAKLHEINPLIRIGIGSGEYPHGTKHVLALGVDFYFSTNDIRYDKEWIVEQMKLGYVSQNDIELRGEKVLTPVGHKGIERF